MLELSPPKFPVENTPGLGPEEVDDDNQAFFKPGWAVLFTLSVTFLSTALAQPTTSLSVEVSGGEHAGTYELTSGDSYCMIGNAAPDSWNTTFGDDAPDPGGLSLFLLTVPHIEGIGAGTSDFSAFVGFGDYGDEGYTEYALDPAKANGSGTLTLEQADRRHAVVALTGETAEGVTLSATLTCNDVLNLSGDVLSEGELGELSFAPDAAAPTGSLSLSVGDRHYEVRTGDDATCSQMAEADNFFSYDYYHAGGSYADLSIYLGLQLHHRPGTGSQTWRRRHAYGDPQRGPADASYGRSNR